MHDIIDFKQHVSLIVRFPSLALLFHTKLQLRSAFTELAGNYVTFPCVSFEKSERDHENVTGP